MRQDNRTLPRVSRELIGWICADLRADDMPRCVDDPELTPEWSRGPVDLDNQGFQMAFMV